MGKSDDRRHVLTLQKAKLFVAVPPLVVLVLLGLFFAIILSQPGPSMVFVAFLVFVCSLAGLVVELIAIRRLTGLWAIIGAVAILFSSLTLLFGAALGVYPFVLNAMLGY